MVIRQDCLHPCPVRLELRDPKRGHHLLASTQRQSHRGSPECRQIWTSLHLAVTARTRTRPQHQRIAQVRR